MCLRNNSYAVLVLIADLLLIEVHDPTGRQRIFVNPNEIISLREPQDINKQHFVKGTNCVLVMTNKNIIAIHEDCVSVTRKLLEKRHAE